MTNTQNNKLCLRQLDTSSAIESVTLLLQKYGTSASQIRASTEIMLQDQGRSNFKTFFSIYWAPIVAQNTNKFINHLLTM